MGNCNTRKFPDPGSSTSWRRCGYYNDWIFSEKFCTPPVDNGSNDSKFCNGVGGESEWKLRTPAHKQSPTEFIEGGGNSVSALQDVIPQSGDKFQEIKTFSEKEYISRVAPMRSRRKHRKNHSVNPNDTKGMGPLYGQPNEGDEYLPLWDNWLHTYSDNEFPHCKYNDWRKNGVQGTGCCSKHYSSCGIVGGMKVTCLRDEFAANNEESGSISCCFNDLVCEPGMSKAAQLFADAGQDGQGNQAWISDDKCFRSAAKDDMRTCKPESRDLGSQFCADTITPYCTGEKVFPGQTHWLQSWDMNSNVNVNEADNYRGKERPVMVKGPCAQLLMRQISGQSACGQSFDQYQINAGSANINGMLWAKETLQKVFTKYINEYGSPILGVNQDGIEAAVGVNNFLYNLCQKFPALCSESLLDMCQSVTEERIAQNPLANKWCGCYMPESQYEKYSAGSFLVTRQCTPFCSRNNVIPQVDSDYQTLYCQENICIMNDIVLDFLKAEGSVNFSQVCNSCGSNSTVETASGSTTSSSGSDNTTQTGNTNIYNSSSNFNSYSTKSTQQKAQSCQCKLDGINLQVLNSSFANINFANECGGTQCTNSSGLSVPCSGSGTSDDSPGLPNINTNISNIKNLKDLTMFKKFFIISLIIFVLIMLYYLLIGNKKKFFVDAAGKKFSLLKGQNFTVDNGFINLNK